MSQRRKKFPLTDSEEFSTFPDYCLYQGKGGWRIGGGANTLRCGGKKEGRGMGAERYVCINSCWLKAERNGEKSVKAGFQGKLVT